MDNFANIGKAVLLQSLGLQKNYTEIIEDHTDVIDYNAPSCSDCKYRALVQNFPEGSEIYESAQNACNNCPNKTLVKKAVCKKVYHNEKNRYGYKPRLKSNAIRLFLLLHFYHPDRFGIISGIDLSQLGARLGCDIKTVKNNLEILKNYSYISYCKVSPHCINLCITDYEQYYLPAARGGRGFLVLSKPLLEQLLSLDSLISLRLHLRELVELDSLNAKGPFTAVSKTYQELRRFLPDYCKPCLIRQAVQPASRIFDISFNGSNVRFEIRDAFNARKQKQECYDRYICMFQDFMKEFNETVIYMNSSNSVPPDYAAFFDVPSVREYRLICIRDFEFEDMAQLALQYSYDHVMDAFCQIYKTYMLHGRNVVNLGGLLRTAIISRLSSSHQAA